MGFWWTLILYVHASGTVLPIASYQVDKPDCDAMATAMNAGHDTGIQTFVCVATAPAELVPAAPARAPRSTGITVSPDFLRGVAMGMELPR